MSTVGGYHEYTWRYHDKCGGRSLGKQLNLYGNPSVLNMPRCTHDIPRHSSWYHLSVLMESPTVLNTPRCTHDIPHCTEHPQCTEHPPVKSVISPSVLKIPRCTAQTLCKVIIGTSSFFYQKTKTSQNSQLLCMMHRCAARYNMENSKPLTFSETGFKTTFSSAPLALLPVHSPNFWKTYR